MVTPAGDLDDSDAPSRLPGADVPPGAEARSRRAVRRRPTAHTYDGYVRTGGYAALRKALTAMTPEQVHDEVKASEMQGRGGAGFPAGTKWGFLPPDVFPRYVVVNGDESEPGTYKDRLLMELDPHQLIEGVLIACYAVKAAQALPLRPRRDGAGPGANRAGAQRRLRPTTSSAGTSSAPTSSVDITLTWGAGAYIVGEETALIESLEGERGMPRLKPPYFPAAKGLYMQPTIVNNVETLANVPVDRHQRRPGVPRRSARRHVHRHADVRGQRPRQPARRVRGAATASRRSACCFEAPEYCGGIRDGRAVKAFIPGGASAIVVLRRAPRPAARQATVDKAGSMLGSGAIIVMDDHDRHGRRLLADRALLRPRELRQVHAVPRGHDLAGADPEADPRRRRPPGRPRLLMEVSDGISPGIAWPPRQTTICPLGPSAASARSPRRCCAFRRRVRALHRRTAGRSTASSRHADPRDDGPSGTPPRSSDDERSRPSSGRTEDDAVDHGRRPPVTRRSPDSS